MYNNFKKSKTTILKKKLYTKHKKNQVLEVRTLYPSQLLGALYFNFLI